MATPESRRPTGSGAAGELYRYSGLGLAFAATIGVFALAGHWLDGRLESGPWLLLVGVFLGFALGLISMLKKLPAGKARAFPSDTTDDTTGDEHDDDSR